MKEGDVNGILFNDDLDCAHPRECVERVRGASGKIPGIMRCAWCAEVEELKKVIAMCEPLISEFATGDGTEHDRCLAAILAALKEDA